MKKVKYSRLLTGFAKVTGFLPALLFFKPKVIYKDKSLQGRRLPKPGILVSNHKSLMDFVLYLLVFCGRNVHFLMGEVLFRKNPVLSRLLFRLGGIYVDRDVTDFSFIAESLSVLDAGGTVGVFPQGRLPVGNTVFPFKPGVVMIALRTEAPIVPVYTEGNYGLFRRARVVVGTPLYLRQYCEDKNPSAQTIETLTALLQKETLDLARYLK